MARLCVMLAVLLVVGAVTEGSRIVFPSQLEEGEPCVTPSGTPGTCSCDYSSDFQEAARCGIKNSAFLVCCDTTLDGSVDVSPPAVTFDCAASSPQVVRTGFDVRSPSPIPGDPPSRITWPWMALVGRKEGNSVRFDCTGILINEHWILSEAYCFTTPNVSVVRLGEYDYNDDIDGAAHQDFSVTQIVNHPDYSSPQGANTLALVKLGSRVAFQEYISPVCLPWGAESKNNIVGRKAKLLSFGNGFGDNAFNSVQKEIEVTVFPLSRCQSSYSTLPQYSVTWPQGIGEETLCAGDPNGLVDACTGDSGGPLVTQEAHGRYVVAGIVSQGIGCGSKKFPGIYVNLRYAPYLSWIKKVAFAN